VALIAAWMSAYSSTLNSLTAVTMEDFVSPWQPYLPKRYVSVSKYVLLAWGVATMVFGFFAGSLAATAIEAINKIGSVTYGRSRHLSAHDIAQGDRPWRQCGSGHGRVREPRSLVVFSHVFWFWWNAIGAVVTVTVGVVLGLLQSGSRGIRTPPRRQVGRQLAASRFVKAL